MFNFVRLITSSLDKNGPSARASTTVLATDSPNASIALNGGINPFSSFGSNINLLACEYSKLTGLKWNPRSIISSAISKISHNPSSLFEELRSALNCVISARLAMIASLPCTSVSIS